MRELGVRWGTVESSSEEGIEGKSMSGRWSTEGIFMSVGCAVHTYTYMPGHFLYGLIILLCGLGVDIDQCSSSNGSTTVTDLTPRVMEP